jgi:hypothetical protein
LPTLRLLPPTRRQVLADNLDSCIISTSWFVSLKGATTQEFKTLMRDLLAVLVAHHAKLRAQAERMAVVRSRTPEDCFELIDESTAISAVIQPVPEVPHDYTALSSALQRAQPFQAISRTPICRRISGERAVGWPGSAARAPRR